MRSGTDDGAAAAVDRVRATPPRLGRTRLVCVDGPAGSGKTTWAAGLAAAWGPGATVLHMDDLYAGWTPTGAFARLAAGVLRPMAAGHPGAYHRYDWAAGRFELTPTPVPVPELLVVEGCFSCPREVDPWAALTVWVEAPQALRLARGLARDGADHEEHWRRWQEREPALFAAHDTRARAGLVVDGTRPADRPDAPPGGGGRLGRAGRGR